MPWALIGVVWVACGSDEEGLAATAQVRNDFRFAKFTLVRVAYREAIWTEAIGPGQQSEEKRVSAGLDHAYALAVWEYDPQAVPPQIPLVMRTHNKVEAIRDVRTDIVFSEANHLGKCGGMTQEEYESIAATYFAGFEIQAYDDIFCPGA